MLMFLGLARAAGAAPCGDEDPAQAVRTDVGFLASPALDGRAVGSTGDAAARAYIAERFACLGLVPAFPDGYAQGFVVTEGTTANLVGYIEGTDAAVRDEIILVSAHHDHLGAGHLGANDNASGIAALLEIARTLRASRPRRTIAFAAFGAEETGMQGSYFYAAHPATALSAERIVQVINLDMVGSHRSRGIVAAMGTFAHLAATPILRRLAKQYPKLNVALGGKARGSDFEPFCKQGTPYVFFWTPDKACYHGTCDKVGRIDWKRMIDITALAGDLVAALAATEVDLAATKQRFGCDGKNR